MTITEEHAVHFLSPLLKASSPLDVGKLDELDNG